MKFEHFGKRTEGIGGTDARIIVTGDWNDLWEEKMGMRDGPNLDHVFKVQLGKFTEPLHASWYNRQTGNELVDPGDIPTCIAGVKPPEDFMFATFDRWIVPLECPLEMKHTHGGNNLEECASYYMAQLQHQMMVAGVGELVFSIIKGNEEPVHGTVSFDQDYCNRLLELERSFWRHVVNEERPPIIGIDVEGLPQLAAQIPINGRKPYDLGKNNEFVSLATDYRRLKPEADAFKQTDAEIRKLIPKDASIVTGGGLQFKRDARGAFRCTVLESADASPPLPQSAEA